MTLETIGALLQSHIVERAAQPAILAPGRPPLTYGDLGRQISTTAGALTRMGIGRGDRLACVLPNGPEAATALISAVSVTSFAPLHPDLSSEEADSLLADLQPKALLIDEGRKSAIYWSAKFLGIPILELHTDKAGPAGRFRVMGRSIGQAARREPGPDDICLILSTSGTSGRPKLVPLTHRAEHLTARWLVEALALGPQDCCLNFAPLYHVLGINGGLLAPLAGGGSVVCAPEFHATEFFQWLDEFRPTFFSAVPAVHQTILERGPQHADILSRQRLRFMRTGGAPLAAAIVARIEQTMRAPLLQVYGMTEAPPIANDLVPPHARKPGSVGKLRGNRVATMDEEGNLLPPGSTGEIVVSGPAVTPGYLNNPDANARAFHNGWFRTGDIGRLDEDGFLFLTGRQSEFINRGGEKISPVEVDEALLTHPAVTEAVTFAVPDARLGQEVAAAVVLRSAASPEELRRHVTAHLAPHKIPRRIFALSSLPKGPTGKISRAHMAESLGIERISPVMEIDYVAPHSERERALCEIWASVLGLPRVGVHDNFFDIGGDSLLAAHCLTRVGELAGIGTLPLTVLLEAPTVAQLALLLDDGERLTQSRRVVPIQPRGSRLPLFVVAPGLEYRRLAHHMGADYPVFGLDVPNLEKTPAPHSIEATADDCLASLLSFRPNGPYALAGFCLSGVIAMEVARRLKARGELVAFVAMIDARIVVRQRLGGLHRWLVPFVHHLQNFAFHMRRSWAASGREGLSYLAARIQGLGKRLRGFARRVSPAVTLEHYELAAATLARFVPRPYRGALIHLWASERPSGLFRDADFYWGGIAEGGNTVIDIPGDHLSIFVEPNVAVMARRLTELIDQAEARESAA